MEEIELAPAKLKKEGAKCMKRKQLAPSNKVE